MKIPKVIHKVIILEDMETPQFTPELDGAINSFREMNPGYTLKLYNGNDCIAYIKKHYNEEILWAFLKLKSFCYQSDLFRQLVLYREGGFYSDMRQLCLKPFDECFSENMEWFSAKDTADGDMSTGFIASIAGSPWPEEMISRILFNIKAGYYGKNPLYPTGPHLFGQVCRVKIDNPDYCFGEHRYAIASEFSLDKDYCFFTQEGEVFLKSKIDKPDGGKYSGGEWENDKGNNYNHLWHNRDVYQDRKSLKKLREEYACGYNRRFFQDVPVKLRCTPEKFLDFYRRKGYKFIPGFVKPVARYVLK